MLTDLISYLSGKQILVWGLGKEGVSTVEFLSQHLNGQSFTVTDTNAGHARKVIETTPMANFMPEAETMVRMGVFDLILKSPGISLRPFGFPLGIQKKVRGQADLFLQFAPGRLIGVTGTKGKSTTSSLITHLLQTPDRPVPLVGNIGVPCWSILKDLDENSTTVLELSSYQLENARHSPEVAVLLNLYQEHLNFHGSLDAYWTAKWNIARHQKYGNTLVFNAGSKEIEAKIGLVPKGVNKIGFGTTSDDFYSLQECQALRGEHNRLNAQAAVVVAGLCGIADQTVRERLKTFQGLPHRLEFIGRFHGVSYYNDSISTVPEAAMAAMAALPETGTIILGGQNRGVDYTHLAQALQQSNISTIILVSETGEILRSLLPSTPRIFWVEHLKKAVELAQERTSEGGTCLFSPAAPSYNQFRNFEERGELFKRLVQG